MSNHQRKGWFHEHPILIWTIISIVFAIIIHILFSLSTTNNFFVAKWSAGELLAYASTVALGLLALWQNKRFKEENDEAQQRLERINEQANSLSIISKIIEIEHDNLARLRMALDEFSSACDPIEIASHYGESLDSRDQKVSVMSAMGSHEKRIDDSFFTLLRELRISPKLVTGSSDPFIVVMCEYYQNAKEVVRLLKADTAYDPKKESETLAQLKMKFLSQRELILIRKELMLNRAIYGNLSLDEIKRMYHEEYTKKEGVSNG